MSLSMLEPDIMFKKYVDLTIQSSFLIRFICQNQTRAQALKHYSTKVDYIRTNLETLEDTIQKKRENMNYLVNILQSKIQTQTQGGPQPGWVYYVYVFFCRNGDHIGTWRNELGNMSGYEDLWSLLTYSILPGIVFATLLNYTFLPVYNQQVKNYPSFWTSFQEQKLRKIFNGEDSGTSHQTSKTVCNRWWKWRCDGWPLILNTGGDYIKWGLQHKERYGLAPMVINRNSGIHKFLD